MNMVNSETIETIVQRARLGDKEAFGVLYTTYFTPLYRYMYFRVKNKLDADDLTQEVFLKAYAAFPRYTYAGGSPLAYFYTIARNLLIDHYRKKTVPVADEGAAEKLRDDTPGAEALAIQKEEYERVRAHMMVLPEDQQEALTLRFIEELSTQEIAALMEKNEAAVRQLQSRGLRTLRERMQNKDNKH
jgi:RNA polymerase sigma-70 factor, ECF subfamily